jgi:hypothetical protein
LYFFLCPESAVCRVMPCCLLLAIGLQPDAPDVSLTGWNSSKESYSFAYISEDDAAAASTSAAGPIKLLLKALVMDDTSLVTCLATDASGVEPKTLELNLENYTTPSSSSSGTAAGTAGTWPLAAKTYKNLDQLAQQVNSALGELTAAAVGSSGGSSAQKQQSTAAAAAAQSGEAEAVRSNPGQQGSRPAEPQQQPDPDYDPLRIGPPRRPMRVGELWQQHNGVQWVYQACQAVVLQDCMHLLFLFARRQYINSSTLPGQYCPSAPTAATA